MKINISESYVDYLYEYFKGGIELPFKNNGFNISFIKYKNKYLFITRNVFPIKNIIEKKELLPGISIDSYKKYVEKVKEYVIENSDLSEHFIWSWHNFYQTSIIFVGDLDNNLNITINKNIKPYAIVNPIFCLNYKENNKVGCAYYFTNTEDFRLYEYGGRIYMINSTVNIINQVIIKSDSIKIFNKFNNICNPIINMNKRNLSTNSNNSYIKIYEKNWTLFKVNFENNKESLFSFFHDFTKNGIECVDYNPITKKCKKYMIIKYPENTFPIDTNIVRFSFGSTSILFKSDTLNGYMGVGHVKIRLHKEEEKTKTDKYFYDLFLKVHYGYKKIFKNKYKPHHVSQYSFFFFLYDSDKKKFYISDMYLPLIEYKYYFNLVFPMSIIQDNNNIIVSMGYGDYTNIFIKYTKKEIEKIPFYDVTKLDITNLKLNTISN
jgi:hypothetical protein